MGVCTASWDELGHQKTPEMSELEADKHAVKIWAHNFEKHKKLEQEEVGRAKADFFSWKNEKLWVCDFKLVVLCRQKELEAQILTAYLSASNSLISGVFWCPGSSQEVVHTPISGP